MSFTAQFKQYLIEQKLSSVSIKNYLSDINKFLAWLEKFRNGEKMPISPSDFQAYATYLINNQVSQPSYKRYLSTLRRYGEYLQACGDLQNNPMSGLLDINQAPSSANPINMSKLLDEYERSLKKENLSEATVRNYLVDMRQFLAWLAQNE